MGAGQSRHPSWSLGATDAGLACVIAIFGTNRPDSFSFETMIDEGRGLATVEVASDRAGMRPEECRAFLSYAHADDAYLGGMVSTLRDELEEAVKFVTARAFHIFQDKNGIGWGQAWRGRLDGAIGEARFLIPILTPSFFTSSPCCDEVRLFREFEAKAGRDDLILPIYLQQADVFDDEAKRSEHEVASLLFQRQFVRWPKALLHEPPASPEWRRRAYQLAEEIGRICKQTEAAREGAARAHRLRAESLAQDIQLKEAVDPAADPITDARKWADQLRDEAKNKQNRLPEAFPFRSLEECLDGILMLLAGASSDAPEGDAVCDLGEQARFLLDFALALRDQPFAEREELAALEPLLLDLLALFGPAANLPLMECDPAPWPEGTQAPVRTLLAEIKSEIDALGDDIDEAERRHLDRARYHHSVLSREACRDRPTWPSLRRSGQGLNAAVNAAGSVAFEALQDLASGLAGKLRDAAGVMISRLPDLASFQDLPDAPVMVVISPGSFDMGSKEGEGLDDERPQHSVTIERRFALGRYPVTLENYAPFVTATGHEGKGAYVWKDGDVKQDENADWRAPGFEQTPQHPVVCVSWEDAQAYVTWLSDHVSADYRLPSEAVWEFSCRAGTTTVYSFGDDFSHRFAHGSVSSMDSVQNMDDIPNVDDVGRTAKVGTYPTNPWRLCDMHGNVWEWVQDSWHNSYEGAPADGSAWVEGKDSSRVLRGGSWINGPDWLRSANRLGDNPV